MRLFKFKPNINWKYVFGEIFLIFVGINLAIWFNNWNASKRIRQAKKVAIEKIAEEIKSNRYDLDTSYQNATLILNAMKDIKRLYWNTSSTVKATPSQMRDFQQQYPRYFRVQDSTRFDSTLFLYQGKTFIELELIELTQIAWETTKNIDLLNSLNYECLYQLESMYNLQKRVQKEVDKAGEALQKGQFDDLTRILAFLLQLEEQLAEEYTEMLKNIVDCR